MEKSEILLIAIGLAMDAFTVSICKGLSIKSNTKNSLIIGLYFGISQTIMALLGFFFGTTFEKYIINIDHWIIFIVLFIIGINMIRDTLIRNEEKENNKVDFKTMFPLAIATSIDSLAVGVTFSFLNINIYNASLLIGIISFILSFSGVKIGSVFGNKFDKIAEFLGGSILILLGIKILLEHLNIM
ncbi:MAG: manganese efflux pump [Bacilli bacterium]|nr:manganese efflux pump [Bacilli bacterium]